MINKQALRKIVKEKISQLPLQQRYDLSMQILAQLQNNERFKSAQTIMLYYSLPDEVDTHEFIEYWAEKKQIMLPIVKGEDIKVCRYTSQEAMKTGAFHISEPTGELFTDWKKIELIVVPGLAFDVDGNRLGRGRGFYDRFLSNPALSKAHRIGICFPQQCFPQIPAEPHDIRMHEIVI